MYTKLLKQHEEILKKLTDKASKETDFGERGQFINIQKMIGNELDAIKQLTYVVDMMPSIESKIKMKLSKERAEQMMDDYDNHLQGDGVFDSTKTLKEKHDFIIKMMSE